MKQIQSALLVVCTFLLTSGILSAQNSDTQPGLFNEGIIVLENGSELNALIQVEKWQINPDNVTIKRSETADPETLTLDQVRSFSIPGKIKFVRHTVQVDISRNPNHSLSDQKEPSYSTRTVFLKVLVEGDASLYSYESKYLYQHFYFKTNKSEVTYLVYKPYLANPGGYSLNIEYRHQLYSRLKCKNTRMSKLPKIEYEYEDLIDHVVTYNKCTGSEVITYEIEKTRDKINVFLSAGVNSTDLTIYYSRLSGSPNLKLSYGATSHISLNGGIELMLPLKSFDWSILSGFSYQSFEAKALFKTEPYIGRSTRVKASSLNLIAELRKYFRIKQNHALFLSGAIGLSLNSGSQFDYYHMLYKANFSNASFYQISAGYMWREWLYGKISYTPPYDTFASSDVLESELSSLRFGIGISL